MTGCKMALLKRCLGILLFMILCAHGLAQSNLTENRLLKHLLPNDELLIRPVKDQSSSVKVEMGLAFKQLVDVDEVNQIMMTNMWVRLYWNSPFFSWEPADFDNITAVNIQPDKIWKPDFVLYNSVDEERSANLEVQLDTRITVNHLGNISWLAPYLFKSQCEIDIKHFPFDYQTCTLFFASWTYDGTKLDIHPRKSGAIDLDNFAMNGEWILTEVPVERQVQYYSCCPEPYPALVFSIKLQRRSMYYYFNLIIPCILITLLAFLSFFLPPDAGERIGLVMTVLLSMAVFLLIVADTVPKTSTHLPLIAYFFVIVMIEVGLSLFFTCLLLRMHYKDRENKVPRWLRLFGFGILAPLVGHSRASCCRFNDGGRGFSSVYVSENSNDMSGLAGTNIKAHEKMMAESIKYLADRKRKKDLEEKVQSDWQDLAHIFDRFFFLFFLFTLVITCIVVFAQAPFLSA